MAYHRLRKPESLNFANGVPGSHALRDGRVVTHQQAQDFDPVKEGIAEFCEPAEGPKVAAKPKVPEAK